MILWWYVHCKRKMYVHIPVHLCIHSSTQNSVCTFRNGSQLLKLSPSCASASSWGVHSAHSLSTGCMGQAQSAIRELSWSMEDTYLHLSSSHHMAAKFNFQICFFSPLMKLPLPEFRVQSSCSSTMPLPPRGASKEFPLGDWIPKWDVCAKSAY